MFKNKRPTSAIILAILVSVANPNAANAESSTGWNPQLSERILLLPPKRLNDVIEQDFSKSGLAVNMTDIETEISGQASLISELSENLDNYQNEAKIEARHQVIVGKKNYIELLGEQTALKQLRLTTKLTLLQRLERTLAQNDKKNKQRTEVQKIQSELQKKSTMIAAKLKEEISLETLKAESNFSKAFDKNMAAISSLKAAIANHNMQSNSAIDTDASKVEIIRRMMVDTEAELALVDIENELLGHMAHLLSLDAMALAEDVALQSYDLATNSPTFSTPSDALPLFIQ
jgi:hypothetical protein